ncbi:hypothetical protein AB0C69_17145, partial [Actinomadura sp. NPDC048032]
TPGIVDLPWSVSTLPTPARTFQGMPYFLPASLYGKESRPGRKIGHVTALGADLAEVRERARHAADYLRWGPAMKDHAR